jgi:hypothetical protein
MALTAALMLAFAVLTTATLSDCVAYPITAVGAGRSVATHGPLLGADAVTSEQVLESHFTQLLDDDPGVADEIAAGREGEALALLLAALAVDEAAGLGDDEHAASATAAHASVIVINLVLRAMRTIDLQAPKDRRTDLVGMSRGNPESDMFDSVLDGPSLGTGLIVSQPFD